MFLRHSAVLKSHVHLNVASSKLLEEIFSEDKRHTDKENEKLLQSPHYFEIFSGIKFHEFFQRL